VPLGERLRPRLRRVAQHLGHRRAHRADPIPGALVNRSRRARDSRATEPDKTGALASGRLGGDSTSGESSKTARPSETAASARESNDQVIEEAEQGHDNQAQHGAGAIRKTLKKKLNLNAEEEFDLDGQFDEGQVGGDCYVKLGAEAVNFEDQAENVLRSPNGADLVSSSPQHRRRLWSA
jgi:hypothetical protein